MTRSRLSASINYTYIHTFIEGAQPLFRCSTSSLPRDVFPALVLFMCLSPGHEQPTETKDGEELTRHFNNCGLTLFMLLKLPLGEQVLFFIISYLSWIDTIKNNY